MNKLFTSYGKRLYKKRKNILRAKEERLEILHCANLLKYNGISVTPFIRGPLTSTQ